MDILIMDVDNATNKTGAYQNRFPQQNVEEKLPTVLRHTFNSPARDQPNNSIHRKRSHSNANIRMYNHMPRSNPPSKQSTISLNHWVISKSAKTDEIRQEHIRNCMKTTITREEPMESHPLFEEHNHDHLNGTTPTHSSITTNPPPNDDRKWLIVEDPTRSPSIRINGGQMEVEALTTIHEYIFLCEKRNQVL